MPEKDSLSVILTTSNNLLSRLIRCFTRSKVSHAAFYTVVLGVPVVIHAGFGGVQVNTFKAFTKKNTVVHSFPMTGSEDKLSGAISRVGEAYDYVGLIGFFTVVVWRWVGVSIKNPLASSKAVVCSEFIVDVLGLPLSKEETTPKDLFHYLLYRSDLNV